MSKLIVISDADFFEGEAELINRLFENGMQIFHLRKPAAEKDELKSLLLKTDPRFYDRIALHHNHELANEFGIKRIHFPEKFRYLRNQHQFSEEFIFSTSVHSRDGLFQVNGQYDYSFVSPVFKSISKSEYNEILPENFRVPQEALGIKVYALGGINEENIGTVFNRGFYGAAVCGTLWENRDQAEKTFNKLNTICREYVHTF